MPSAGKALIVLGLVLIALGAIVWSAGSVPIIGRLPGDVYIKRGTWSLYLPITTSIVLSVVLTILLSLLSRR